MNIIESWKFLAGIGFFLYGMSQMEYLVKKNSGRSLKVFLKKNTHNLFKAISGGVLITCLLQSSSIVSLMVLAFVETGIITFRNALGVVLGSNLGTTLDGWIMAAFGFKFDMQLYALPVIGLSAIGLFIVDKRKKVRLVLNILFALGILFLGLTYMKDAALELVKSFELKSYMNHGVLVFVLAGFVLTALIQSSSATVAITLTAIYSGILSFESAAAIIIGSEVGTTIKILIWGMKGTADKKRVAWSDFIYNIFTAIFALIFLKWLLYLINDIFTIHDPLIGLVLFQTIINFISILLFIPFLNLFVKWMGKRFRNDDTSASSDISRNLPSLPVLAADAMKTEAGLFIMRTLKFINRLLCKQSEPAIGFINQIKSISHVVPTIDDDYTRLKQTEGDLLEYVASIQQDELHDQEIKQLSDYQYSVRQCVYAAKSLKDINHNLEDFKASANDLLHKQNRIIDLNWKSFELEIHKMLTHPSDNTHEIETIMARTLDEEKVENLSIMNYLKSGLLNEVESSTLMNVQREIISAKKALLIAIEHLGTNGNS